MTTNKYAVTLHQPKDLSTTDLATCVRIIAEGGAIGNPRRVEAGFPKSELVAIVRLGDEIAGVGSVKTRRSTYSAGISKRSGFRFEVDIPELGYVAVSPKHQNQRLSHQIVAALVRDESMFATTDNPKMMTTLASAGFVKCGHNWKGRRGSLSLWIKKGS